MTTSWERVKALFTAALDLPPADRAAFLARECADPALRQEVQSLLDSHAESDTFLESPLHPAPLLPDDDLVGHAVGPYQVLRRIGTGGMGAVYHAARADATFEKTVAIKVVKRGLDTDDLLRRFRDERQMLARLEHPNIARLLDGGSTPDGRPYLVMDYVPGVRIDEYCDAHRLNLAARLRLFQTVCRAVQHAHQNLVIHRDLKPDNILVTEDGVPVLVDFGIAKVLSPSPEETQQVTRLAERPMTLAYASPEQVRGEPMATVSDVYALGVILYELLTGRRPYREAVVTPAAYERALEEGPRLPHEAVLPGSPGSDANAAAGKSDAVGRSAEDVAQARGTDPSSLSRALSGDLDTIVLKAMHRDPERRYASAEQLAEDIERSLSALPVIARPDTVGYRTGKFIRRHRAGVAAAAIVVIALGAGLAGTLWQARVARLERDRARAEAEKAEEITAFLTDTLGAAAPEDQGRDVTVAQALDSASIRAKEQLANQPESLAAIRTTIGRTYLQLGKIEKAIPELEDALAIRRRTPGIPQEDIVVSLKELASGYVEQGDFPRAEPLFRQALDLSRRVNGEASEMTAEVLGDLAGLVGERGDLAESEKMHRETLALLRKVRKEDDSDIARRMNNLAIVVGTQGRWEEAATLMRSVLAIVQRVRGPRHPEVASAMSSLASALDESGHSDEANRYFAESIHIRNEVLGPEHPGTAWARYNYATTLVQHGQAARAEEQLAQILPLRGKVLPDAHPLVAAAVLLAGRAAMQQGKLTAAEPLFRESLKLREASLPPTHWLLASGKGFLGECLTREKRFADAEPLLLASLTGLKNAVGAEDSRTKDAAKRLVALYEAWGKPAQAAAYRRP